MTTNYRPVLYRAIRPQSGASLAALCRRAHALGYELVPFNGYDPLSPTHSRAERFANLDRLCEILGNDEYAVTEQVFELWADLPTLEQRLSDAGYTCECHATTTTEGED